MAAAGNADRGSQATLASPDPIRRFPMPIADRWVLPLLLFGVRRKTAYVKLGDGRFVARFGWSRAETSLANIASFRITGPYRWWRAIGLRRTVGLGDKDVSFGTTARGGVCLTFRERIRVGFLRTSELTVTVADLDGLAAALRELGIPGKDARTAT
jgi:hypothetical protein